MLRMNETVQCVLRVHKNRDPKTKDMCVRTPASCLKAHLCIPMYTHPVLFISCRLRIRGATRPA